MNTATMNSTMAHYTVSVPVAEKKRFTQLIHLMGWSYASGAALDLAVNAKVRKKDASNVITPSLQKLIDQAMEEEKRGGMTVCRTHEEMQQFFDSL